MHYFTQLGKSVVDGGLDVRKINCPLLKGLAERREDGQDRIQVIDGSNEFCCLDFAEETTCHCIFILELSQRL